MFDVRRIFSKTKYFSKNIPKKYYNNKKTNYSDNIIIGGGPVGSSLARQLALNNQQVTLFQDPNNLGSHKDNSRLIRPAFDGSFEEYNLSLKSIQELIEMNQASENKFILSNPGVLIAASPQTPLYEKMMIGQDYDRNLSVINSEKLRARFPHFQFNFPLETRLWFHPSGYVINPQLFSSYNLDITKKNNGMVINKPASFQFEHLEFKVKSDDASVETNTKNLYVLSGANNKKIIRDSNFYVHEFEQTHLNSISTIRYFSSNNITFNLMPITVGQLNFLNYPDLLDFSTMPEGNGIIKTRLSGFGTSERVESILDKDKIPKEMMQDMSYSLFTTIFPTIGEQIDFNRCVTYRNNLPNFHALSPLKLHYKG
ncbi:MAG: FAD-binding oxidoreductase, partial [Silvanigrellaceae bacterium]|nr:FAD-binding oxidoreductase [Silvanigrellaceae bacterium]